MDDHNQVWTDVTALLREQISESVWLSTFADVRPLEATTEVLRVSVPSRNLKERIQTRYLPVGHRSDRRCGRADLLAGDGDRSVAPVRRTGGGTRGRTDRQRRTRSGPGPTCVVVRASVKQG